MITPAMNHPVAHRLQRIAVQVRRGARLPSDTLLHAMAKEFGQRVCVILSGTGADGSLGLSETTIPDLVRHHNLDRPLRLWVAGRSTGEETYSLAVICRGGHRQGGVYPRSIECDVSSARLSRFFTKCHIAETTASVENLTDYRYSAAAG